MAFITETATYEASIYEIATTDKVKGGTGEISNVQAEKLANRTKYLKLHVDAIENDPTKFREVIILDADTVLDDTYFGALIVIAGNGANVNITLPPSAAGLEGKRIVIVNKSAYSVIVARAGADLIDSAATSVTLLAINDKFEAALDLSAVNYVTIANKITTTASATITDRVVPANFNTSSGAYVDLPGATYTTPNDGITRKYRIYCKSSANWAGSAGDGALMKIMVGATAIEESEVYLDVLAATVDLIHATLIVEDIYSAPPATIIKIMVQSVSGGGIDFNKNKFTIQEIKD
jgi:hypothetical protein